LNINNLNDQNNNVSNFNNNIRAQDYEKSNHQKSLNFSKINFVEKLNINNNIIFKDDSFNNLKDGTYILSDKVVEKNKTNTYFYNSKNSFDEKIETSRSNFKHKVRDLGLDEKYDLNADQISKLNHTEYQSQNLHDFRVNNNINSLIKKKIYTNPYKYRHRLGLKIEKEKPINEDMLEEIYSREGKKTKIYNNSGFIQNEYNKNIKINNNNSGGDEMNHSNPIDLINFRNSEEKNILSSEYKKKVHFHQNKSSRNSNSQKFNKLYPIYSNSFSNIHERHNDSLFHNINLMNHKNTSQVCLNKTNEINDNSNFIINNKFETDNSYLYNINNNDSIKMGTKIKCLDQNKKTRELTDYFFNSNRPLIQMDICEQIKFIIKQYEFYLQLILQNIFLTDDSCLKYRGYSLIYNMYLQKMRIINQCRLPHFDVYYNFCKVKK